jgi:hypothetical protein
MSADDGWNSRSSFWNSAENDDNLVTYETALKEGEARIIFTGPRR